MTGKELKKLIDEHGYETVAAAINAMIWQLGNQKSDCPALPYGSTACIIAKAYGFSDCDCLG